MTVNKAVRKLHNDLSKLHQAEGTEKKAEAKVKADQAGEKKALASLAAQQSQLIDAFVAAPPTDPTQLQKLLGQFVTLGEKQAQTQDSFSKRIAGDHQAVSHDKKAIGSDKKAALKDLKPAEYHLSLKDTNAARKQLGLGALKKPLRAAPVVNNTVGGQVGKWIAEAQTALKAAGVPLSKMNAADINIIIQHESSGNPNAVNNWDSNAAAGHPSKGLMQTIQPTFDSYKLPGHNNILNPVDNIIAGVRYAISRYGSISNVPGVVDVHAGRAYVGY
jgi:hypothetical protein